MRVLLTGNKGYIGTVMAPLLLAANHDVVGLDSDLYKKCTFGKWKDTLPTIQKDLRDLQASDLQGFDAIIHLAALSNDPLGDLNPSLTHEINYLASVRLAELAKSVGVSRFLFSSSCSTYGAADSDEMLTEEAPLKPVTTYGHSKVLVEKEVSKLADDSFHPVFLRNSTAYGVSPRHRFDIVLNNLTAWAVTTGLVYLKSDGSPWRPIVHIEDIAQAFLVMLAAPLEKVHNQAYNVGINTENYHIRDLAEIVREVVPGCRLEYAPGAEPDKRSYRVDFSKLHQTFPEFKPKWDALRGAQELYKAYKGMSLKLGEFEGPRFKRIDHIKLLLAEGKLDQNLRWKN